MSFVYVSERERWRSTMLLVWKYGPLRSDDGSGRHGPIVRLISEYAAPPWPTQPLRKLTVNLITTYTGINTHYYAAKQKWVNSQQAPNGNFRWIDGHNLVLNGRYDLKNQIGHGAFGVVMKALDLQTGEHVAIKIIKARRAYSQQARREINLLQNLRANDADGTSNVVELRAHFVYNNPGVGNHECLVFEMLASNLYTLLEQVQFHGFSLPLVRKFAESLLNSLAFLARPDVRVIHTDIKPENICIRNPRRSAIKLIDFGSSCTEGAQMFSYIQSRYYRSPEVLLGCGYTVAIDMWSLACVLVEMHVGYPLFSGDNQIDQIRKIMQICGPPPDDMVDTLADEKRAQVFLPGPGSGASSSSSSSSSSGGASGKPLGGNGGGSVGRRWVPLNRDGVSSRTLASVLGVNSGGPEGRWANEPGHTPQAYAQFQDLIAKMLVYDPPTRLTPAAGLAHPFITQDYDGSHKRAQEQQQAASSSTATSSSSNGGGGGVGGGDAPERGGTRRGAAPPRAADAMDTNSAADAAAAAAAAASKAAAVDSTSSSTRSGRKFGGGGGGGRKADGSDMSDIEPRTGDAAAAAASSSGSGGGGGGGGIGGGGGGGGQQQMSQQQRQELSVALHDIGCPEGEVLNNPLDWESISYLLEHFTAMNESSRLEARRRYEAFINQPLRARQKKAMQHLIDLLRNAQAKSSEMEVEVPELSLTPAP